jgi:hypothetical protein
MIHYVCWLFTPGELGQDEKLCRPTIFYSVVLYKMCLARFLLHMFWIPNQITKFYLNETSVNSILFEVWLCTEIYCVF